MDFRPVVRSADELRHVPEVLLAADENLRVVRHRREVVPQKLVPIYLKKVQIESVMRRKIVTIQRTLRCA